jgi:5-methylcytosine-specific restriction protein A
MWRGSRQSRGYDSKWSKTRLLVLARDKYLCQYCIKEGRVAPATDVDHIVSIRSGGERLSLSNLQSLCKMHHSQKTATEDGGFGNYKIKRIDD